MDATIEKDMDFNKFADQYLDRLKDVMDEPGDLAIGISGSGNSENLLRGIGYVAAHGGKTAGWSGFGGGKLAEIVDRAFVVDSHDMQQVEDAHMVRVDMIMPTCAALHQTSDITAA